MEKDQFIEEDNSTLENLNQLTATTGQNLQSKNQELESDQDSNIQDLEQEQVSEHESSSNSSFQIDADEIIKDSDSGENDSEDEEIERLNGQIFDEQNEMENIRDEDEPLESDEENQKLRQKKMKAQDQAQDGPKVKVSLRDFQKTLFNQSQDKNSIIYLPTGLGKTRIAIASMYYYLAGSQRKKVVFLANTIQLVKQQAEAIKKTLHGIIQDKRLCKDLQKKYNGRTVGVNWDWKRINKEVVCVHGQKNDEVGQTRRMKIQESKNAQKQFQQRIQRSTIIVMIAQMFLNSLRRGLIKLTDYTLVVFDQCHHCHGSHPYSGIMNEFYFPEKFKIQKQRQKIGSVKKQLPKIMGLTASPVLNPEINDKKLQSAIKQLCINMDSNFARYPQSEYQNSTEIKIIKIEEQGDKDVIPLLEQHFKKFFDHKESYSKLEIHFPQYFACVKQVLDILSAKDEVLGLERSLSQIHHPDYYLFYDLKQSLLDKIKDLWIELGEFVMCLAFSDLISQLKNITGLKEQANEQLKNDIITVLLRYEKIFRVQYEYSKNQPRFRSGKLNKLIQLLAPTETNDNIKLDSKKKSKQTQSDLVLVFAFKRRTVKYLDLFFEKYREKLPEHQKQYYNCTGVTGYSNATYSGVINSGNTVDSDPSSKLFDHIVQNEYEKYLDDYNIGSTNVGASESLKNEANRLYNAKSSKFLLEAEEKYGTQLKKIKQFRDGDKRVLISTSVTQEGFDIPSCNKVISYDTPFSMKAYIQIKGRARKKNSIYYIFTTSENYEEMKRNQIIYKETIEATYEIAINRIANEQLKTEKKSQDPEGYRKVKTHSGALINTNYSLELLKTYYSMLRPPNKGYFHFIETPNIGYKCIIKLPDSDSSGLSMVTGETFSQKQKALKSAAFNTVKQLKILGMIKDDLRPSRLSDLEEEYELQKYDDLAMMQKDEDYLKVFRDYAQFEVQQDKNGGSKRRFLRVHFKAFLSRELDFPHTNNKFAEIQHRFRNPQSQQKFLFQLYQVKFSNTANLPFLKQFPNRNEIGILTCFDESVKDQIFSNFNFFFEENQKQSITFKSVNTSLQMDIKRYQQLKSIHQFLIAGCENRQVQYYSDFSQHPPVANQWADLKKKYSYEIDKTRKYYPIMVLLKKNKEKSKFYEIDEMKIKKIQQHRRIFKELYLYFNIPKYSKISKTQGLFKQNLTAQFNAYCDDVQDLKQEMLLQSISPDFIFHKCVIKSICDQSEELINLSKKAQQKHNLQTRKHKYQKIYQHFKHGKGQKLIQRDLWRNYCKEKKSMLFDRAGIKQEDIKYQKHYFLKEFMIYPLSPQTLFKASLTKTYAYDAIESYTMALNFRNIHLRTMFQEKNQSKYFPYCFKHYESLILANRQVFFEYLAQNGKSKALKNLGRSYQERNHSISINQQLDKSQFPDFSDMSGILADDVSVNNQTKNNVENNESMSILNHSTTIMMEQQRKKAFQEDPTNHKYEQEKTFQFKEDILERLNIPELKKVLTSKTYKHQRTENYQEFEFIGDVVLKYLATLQIFCRRPTAQQGSMHIARANIICNANLHKKAIKNKVFRYIMASKRMQPTPPYKNLFDQTKVVRQLYKGKHKEQQLRINLVNSASQAEGYQYIPGKVHADVIQALIGAFYSARKNLDDCQALLYIFDVLESPTTKIEIDFTRALINVSIPSLYSDLQQKMGYEFINKGIMIQSLTHPSFRNSIEAIVDNHNMQKILNQISVNQKSKLSFLSQKTQDYRTRILTYECFYERLEFLGDAVLDLIVVEHLYEKYDRGLDEGTLTMLKQAGVSNKSLGLIALKLGLHEITLMDIPEMDLLQKDFSKLKDKFDEFLAHPDKLVNQKIKGIKLLGDIFEGLVGAIFVDTNFDYPKTKNIIWKMIGAYIEVFTDKNKIKGFPILQFLSNNNYKNCRVQKLLNLEPQDGKFKYGLLDRKNTLIEQCWADNQKDAWDDIIDKLNGKSVSSLKN